MSTTKNLKRVNERANLLVLKFGGTSVKDLGRIHHVAGIIEARLQEGPVIVVVSAMGDTTDNLLRLGKRCTEGEGGRPLASLADDREMDQLLATGEQVSISLLAMTLRARGLKAKSLTAAQAGIVTDGAYGRAAVVSVNAGSILDQLQVHDVLVIAGFQGVSESGDITTLGRGGSDTTAVAVAAACGAAVCDIYTDVDGVFSADPNKVAGARLLNGVSYADVAEMALLGAQVIHPRAVQLAERYGLCLRVRNTFKPENNGTLIQGESKMEVFQPVTGVALEGDNAIISISELPSGPAIVAKVLGLIADQDIVASMVSQNLIANGLVCFAVKQADLARTIRTLNEIRDEYPRVQVSFDPDATKVSIVGLGIANRAAVAAKAFAALQREDIGVKMAATSDRCLSLIVANDQAEAAARALHHTFAIGSATLRATPERAPLAASPPLGCVTLKQA